MSWFGKKKANPEDGDFPRIPRHYLEEKGLTRIIDMAPPMIWNGSNVVVWGIDIGAGATTVSFTYLETGKSIERPVKVHNIVYWPKEFPLRESSGVGVPLPETTRGFKTRVTYTSIGFVSHPSWPSEKTAAYLYITHPLTSPSVSQVRTEIPALESPERHKFSDLVENLLKHALGIYSTVTKPSQPSWPLASEVVITLPSGLAKSAEMTITGELDRAVFNAMPKVMGRIRTFYVRKPDVRLFEDGLWRNFDNNFHDGDVVMLVDWDMTSGDMLCASYKGIGLSSGYMAYGLILRSYVQALPSIGKRDAGADEREGVRFANALHWCAENKHGTRKIIVRTSNPIKKSDNLLAIFHKTLTDKHVQVGLRLIDSGVETRAFGAVMWRVAHAIAQSQSPEGEGLSLIPYLTQASRDVDATAREPQFSCEPEPSPRMSANVLRRANRRSTNGSSPLNTPQEPQATFISTPLEWNPNTVRIPVPESFPAIALQTAVGDIAHTNPLSAGPSNPVRYSSPALPPVYAHDPGARGGYSDHQAIVGWDYRARENTEISLNAGEIISNIDMVDQRWWRGTNSKGQTGLFPANYVRSKEPAPSK